MKTGRASIWDVWSPQQSPDFSSTAPKFLAILLENPKDLFLSITVSFIVRERMPHSSDSFMENTVTVSLSLDCINVRGGSLVLERMSNGSLMCSITDYKGFSSLAAKTQLAVFQLCTHSVQSYADVQNQSQGLGRTSPSFDGSRGKFLP